MSRYEVVTIIGEIEGHEEIGGGVKTTKYENVIPLLTALEENDEVEGILIIVNTVGGDVACGLALAELIAGLSKPTVSLVLGDCHSIGVPIVVAADYSFIAPTATVVLHPVRMRGTILGTKQTMKQFKSIQDRILSFVADHSNCPENELENMIMDSQMFSSDLGTIMVGEEAVNAGIINAVGSIHDAIAKIKDKTN